VGTSTRADVEAAIGTGLADAVNPFRVTYCGLAARVEYVDADGAIALTGAAAATDRVARVLTLNGASAAALGVSIGAAPPDTAATATVTVGDGDIRFYAADGLSLLSAGGLVTQITAFRPQDRDVWTIPLTLASDEQSLQNVDRDSTFGDAAALLGTAHDAQGVIAVGGIVGNVLVRIWASAGVRIAGRCGSNCANADATGIDSITLSPPFLGKDAGVGIGSSRAEVEADVGTGEGPDSNNVVVYGDEDPLGFNDPALGVVYVQDTQCVERAAALIFNYNNPT